MSIILSLFLGPLFSLALKYEYFKDMTFSLIKQIPFQFLRTNRPHSNQATEDGLAMSAFSQGQGKVSISTLHKKSIQDLDAENQSTEKSRPLSRRGSTAAYNSNPIHK